MENNIVALKSVDELNDFKSITVTKEFDNIMSEMLRKGLEEIDAIDADDPYIEVLKKHATPATAIGLIVGSAMGISKDDLLKDCENATEEELNSLFDRFCEVFENTVEKIIADGAMTIEH